MQKGDYMKNSFIILMNLLFIMVIAADVVSVKYGCDSKLPKVTKSSYQELQAQIEEPLQTADMNILNNYKL